MSEFRKQDKNKASFVAHLVKNKGIKLFSLIFFKPTSIGQLAIAFQRSTHIINNYLTIIFAIDWYIFFNDSDKLNWG